MSEKLFITRKRKKYKFAKFDEFENCFQLEDFTLNAIDDVVLEVGAGTGLFSVELARLYPEKTFIAVDIKSDRLYTGAKLADEFGLKNIMFVRGEISRFMDVVPENKVNEIWITFPDPYASEDQTRLTSTGARKRLTASKFLDMYKKTLFKKGHLYFKTDNEPLFDWSVSQLKDASWKIDKQTRDLHNSTFNENSKIMTTYEKRFIEKGLPIFFLSATIDK